MHLTQLPASALSWQLDDAGFDQLVTELMRRNDTIPFTKMLAQTRRDAGERLAENFDDVETIIDRLTSFAALALQYSRSSWFEQAVAALVGIYDYGFDKNYGHDRHDIDAPRLWLEVISRVYALGGLAVRLRNWGSLRLLADRRPHGQSLDWFGSWLRHAVTMAARAHIFESPQDAGLIGRAQNVVRSLEALHLDVDPESDDVLNIGVVEVGIARADTRSVFAPTLLADAHAVYHSVPPTVVQAPPPIDVVARQSYAARCAVLVDARIPYGDATQVGRGAGWLRGEDERAANRQQHSKTGK